MDRRRLVSLCAVWLLGAAMAFGQAPSGGPVVELRKVLDSSFPTLEERDAAIARCIGALEELSDLQEALQLRSWHTDDLDVNLAEVDGAAKQLVCRRFIAGAAAILQNGTLEGRLALFEMLHVLETSPVARELGVLVPVIVKLTADDQACLQLQAIHTLGAIPTDHRVVLPVLEQLLESSQPGLRLAATDAVCCMLERWQQRALLARSEEEKKAVRGEIVEVAGAVLPVVMRSCQDADVPVRRRAIRAVRTGLQAVHVLLLGPSSQDLGAGALATLLETLQGPRIFVIRTLHDTDVDVRIQSRLALEELTLIQKHAAGNSADADAYKTAVEETTEPAANAQQLEEWRSALPELTAAVGDADIRARLRAIDILEALGPVAEPAAPALIDALKDRDRFVRWSAARALGKIGPVRAEQALPALEQLLADGDLDVRLAAARTLGSYGATAQLALGGLLRALEVKNAEQRLAVLRVLHTIGAAAQPAVPALCSCLADPEPRVRCKAAAVLGDLGGLASPAADVLRHSLTDADADVRQAAGKALMLVSRRSAE